MIVRPAVDPDTVAMFRGMGWWGIGAGVLFCWAFVRRGGRR